MFKKLWAGVLCLCLAVGAAGCAADKSGESGADTGKLNVIATIFPQYDFARQIGGDKVNVKMLLPAGTESHTFDPKPSDIVAVQGAEVFLYTGNEMEPWAQNIVNSLDPKKVKVVNLSQGIPLVAETHSEGGTEHEHESDPHIWLDPTLAMKMVDATAAAFGEKDPDNKAYYTQNAENYKAKLGALDQDFQTAVAQGQRKQLAFGGKFAYIYFIRRYGLEYASAFDSCSTQSEPSVKKIGDVISYIKENGIPVVFYEELATPKVATSIAGETGTKTLLFSTVHNVTKDEFQQGVTYLDVMRQNLKNLKTALGEN